MTTGTLKQLALAVAEKMAAAASPSDQPIAGTGGGSLHRGLPEEVRQGFIDVRAALFQRGMFDPVLARFDTATVPQASTTEIAERLAAVASQLD